VTGTTGGQQADNRHDTLMWEARAAPGRLADLLRWVDSTVLPALAGDPGAPLVDVYSSADERVVVVIRSTRGLARLPEPPAGLLRRPPHQWPFRHRSSLGDPAGG
jgi:hypothetical protein